MSGKILNDWISSELPPSNWGDYFNSYEEYVVERDRCETERRELEEKIRKILDQDNIIINQTHAEFFTAIKIEGMNE